MGSTFMKKALIIGSAKSGNAVSKLLAAHGYDCILIDERKIVDQESLKKSHIELIEGAFNLNLLDTKYDLIVKNPGIPHTHPFIQACLQKGYFIYTEIEVAFWFAKYYRYASITGTNGKTTTTELLQAMLKLDNEKNTAAGNLGLPLSDIVLSDQEGNKKIAMEIAAFQLLGIKDYHPEVSVILNLAPDHLDVFKDTDEYYQAKALVYKNQTNADWFLRNIDDENVLKYAHPNCKIVDYSLIKKADLYLKDKEVILFDQILFNIDDLKIKGIHNIQNAMVAAASAYKLDVSIENIQKAIKAFKGVEHRIEFIREFNGIEYFNDSKATTAESTKVALNALINH